MKKCHCTSKEEEKQPREWLLVSTYPYSSKDKPFKKKAGHVRDERSPVKLMTVLINSLNWLPVPGSACLTDMLSTSFTEGSLSPLASLAVLLRLFEKNLFMAKKEKRTKEKRKKKGRMQNSAGFLVALVQKLIRAPHLHPRPWIYFLVDIVITLVHSLLLNHLFLSCSFSL